MTGLETTTSEVMSRRAGQVQKVRGLQGSEPVVEGTRVPVERIQELHHRGWDEARILAAHPHLTGADVKADLDEPGRRRARTA